MAALSRCTVLRAAIHWLGSALDCTFQFGQKAQFSGRFNGRLTKHGQTDAKEVTLPYQGLLSFVDGIWEVIEIGKTGET